MKSDAIDERKVWIREETYERTIVQTWNCIVDAAKVGTPR